MPKLLAVLALLAGAALLAFGSSSSPAAALTNCTVDAGIDSEEQEFLRLINEYRQQNGLQALALSDSLNRAAAWKSQHMADENYFAHDDTPIGRSWIQRIRDCGYTYNTWLGENLAAGNSTAAATFDQWKNSSGHNANMLSSNYTAIGIGRAFNSSSTYDWYWSTDFGGYSDGYTPPAQTATPTPTRTPTRTPTPTPTGPAIACPDFTNDGWVQVIDIVYVVERYRTADLTADVDDDGVVWMMDIVLVVGEYGRQC